jgi:hypothetical protein
MTAAIAWAPPLELDRPASTRLRAVAAPPSSRRPSAAVLRRRRLLAAALAVGLTATAGRVASGWWSAPAHAGAVPAAPVVVVAAAGDTYWGLAARVGAGGDLRSTVDALVRANGGRELRVGDRIRLPG